MSKSAVVRVLIVIASQLGQLVGVPVTAAASLSIDMARVSGPNLVSIDAVDGIGLAGAAQTPSAQPAAVGRRVDAPLAPSAAITLALCVSPSGACVAPAPVVISAMINVTEAASTIWMRALGTSDSLTVTEVASSDPRLSALLINHGSYAGKQDLPFELSTTGLLRLHPVFAPTSTETVTATLTYTADNGTSASVTVIGRPVVPPVFTMTGSPISQSLGAPISITLSRALTVTNAGPITATTMTATVAVVPDFDPAIARGRVGLLHVDSDAQAADLSAGLLGTGRLLSVTAINTYSETWTFAQLAESFDVLLLDGVPTETAGYWGNQLYDFMVGGGLSIVAMGRAMGDRAPAGLWEQIRVRTPSGFMSSWGSPMALNLNAASTWNSHPILRDIASFRLPAWALPRGSGTYAPDTTFWAHATQDIDGHFPYASVSLITERTVDQGGYRRRLVDLDFQPIFTGCSPDCGFDPSSDGLRLIANTLRYAMQPEVATASTASAVLAPGASLEISVTLNAAHALDGENRSAVLIHHNDPATPDGRLEVLLNADRPAVVRLWPEPASFSNRYISGTYTLTFNLKNTGGESVIVHAITSADPALVVAGLPGQPPPELLRVDGADRPRAKTDAPGPITLAPYSAQPAFQLAWTPVATGALNAALLISASNGTAVFTITGTAFDPSDAIAPQLSSSNHAFPNTLIGNRGGREVYVYHEDPGHLLITGLRTSDPRFTMTGELGLPFDLPEDYTYNWYKIALGFHPDATGPLTATGYITTSAGVLAISLSGTGVAPAPYVISTPSISATMFATQTSITRQFQITNTGTQTIQVNTSVNPSFDASVAKGNVAFIHTISESQAAAIVAVLTGTGLLQSVTAINLLTDPPTLERMLQYDALMVDGVSGPNAALVGNRLYEYVDQGGGLVLIGGALRSDQCIPGYLAYWNPVCAAILTNITETLSIGYSDLAHPAMRGVSSFVRPRNGKSAYSNNVIGMVAYTDYPYVLVEIGDWSPTYGEDVPRLDLNFDPVFTECGAACGWEPTTDGARLMANALRLTMGREILRSGTSIAIGPGKTATPTVTLYGQVVSGTNYAEIRLKVDGQDRQTLPVTLNVQGPPSFVQSVSSLGFGNLYLGQSVTFTPFLDNRGASPIDIYTVTISMPHVRMGQFCGASYSICDTSSPTLLRPWSRREFSLIFQPTATGAFTGTAAFSTSVGLKTISLSGASAYDIEVRADPASIYLTTTWNAVHEIPFTLTNLSVVTAFYTVTESSPNIALTGPLTSTLTAGEVRPRAFTATLNTVNILPGAYISNVLVGQSDLFNASERTGDPYPISFYVVDRYLTVTPPSFVYPNAVLGVPLTRTFSLTNQGNLTLSVTGFGIDNADWTPVVSLPITLAPAGRISIPLIFIPSTLGALATTLVISSDAPQARSIGLTATVVLTPQIAIQPAAIDETLLDDEQRPIAITVTNSGQGNLDFTAAAAGGTLFVLTGGSGLLPAGQSARMTATMMGNLMTIGVQYHWPITITSNDPAAAKVIIPVTATNSGRPLPAGLVAPVDGGLGVSTDATFDWTRPTNATGVRFKHWRADDAPPASSQFTGTGATSAYNPPGFLRESQRYFWQTETYNTYGVTLGPVWSFTTEQRIDLQAMSLAAPDFAWSNGQIGVNWVISNAGHLTTTTSWIDRIYLSTQPILDGAAISIGQRSNVSALAPGQAYASSGTYLIPVGTEGLRYIHVKTDANGAFAASREYTPNNSIAGTVMTVSLTPPPDLQVTTASAPSDAFSQQTIQVNYVVSNTSAVTIPATAWVDRIYLSLDDMFGVDDTLKATANQNRSLAPGASYSGSASISLPQGISGTRYVIVWTDATNVLFEHAGESNNTRASNAINVILRPPPDLQVTSVLVPAETGSGQAYTVVYTVANLGPGDTDVSAWTDRIYRNQNPDHSVAPTGLATIGHSGILPAGQRYVVTRTFSMPDGVTGNYYIHIATDLNDDVYEYTDEGNNWGSSAPISVSLTPPPDLQVTGVSAPAFGVAGSSYTVVFTVTNLGAGSTVVGAWADRLYRNEDPDHSVSPVTLGTFNHAGALASGESYTVAAAIIWPAGIATNYYLHVRTDLNDDVYEHNNEDNNWGAGGPISVSLGLTSDLLAERIALLSAASVMRGRTISATWTVANIGEAAASGSWNDRIQLRRLSNSALYTLGTYARPSGLAIGAGYTRTLSIKVPSSVPADDYELRVVADINNTIVENGREANNTAVATATLSVLNALSGETDLGIDQPDAAGAFGSGQPLTLTWRVTNELNTVGPLWRDRVLLRDCSLVCADTLLKDITQTGALAEGQGYAGSAVASLPNGISGTFSLVYETDWLNQVNDIDPLNNAISLPITVTLSPWANLRPVDGPVVGASFSDAWYRGFFRTITWSVENSGAGGASAPWSDRVYLSLNTVLDAGDPVLWTQTRNASLGQGDAYTASANVAMPATVSPGVYYLLVRTDQNDDVYERTDEGDNVRAGARITVDLSPPPNLIVADVSHTVFGNNPGDALVASWTISNAGVATATASSLCDLAYVSADAVWDIGDALLGERCRAIGLPMGANTHSSLVSVIPSLAPGDYRIIVRTDTRFGVAESDEGDNTGVAPITFMIDIPALTLGVTQTGELTNGQVQDFRVDVPAGAALEVKLDSAAGIGANELYLRHGAPASRNAFDEIYPTPNSPDQRVLAPSTLAGTYFIRIYANSGHNHTPYTLLARLVPFAVDSAVPGQVGNAGASTLDIRGSLFTTATQFALIGPGGATRIATSTLFGDAGQVYATFDLKGAPVGAWDVRAAKGATTTALIGGVTVVTGTGGRLEASLQVPSNVRYHELGSSARGYSTLYIHYSNVGDADLVAPVFWVQSPEGAWLGIDSPSDVKRQTVHAIALATEGPVTTLRPGQSGSIPVLFSAQRPTETFTFDLWWVTSDDIRLIDYAHAMANLRPDGIPDPQWALFMDRLPALTGETWGDYDAALAALALAKASSGQRVTDARALLLEYLRALMGVDGATLRALVVDSANSQPLPGIPVYSLGMLGATTTTVVATATTDAAGAFTFTHLAPGTYRLALLQDYAFVETPQITVGVAVTQVAGVFSATRIITSDQEPRIASVADPIIIDANGVAQLAFVSDGAVFHAAMYAGGWQSPTMVSNPGDARHPRMVYSPNMIGGTQPGIALFWSTGASNTQRIDYSVASWNGAAWQWSAPTAYVSATVAVIGFDAVATVDGPALALWQMRDKAQADDSDLYWQRTAITPVMLSLDKIALIGQLTQDARFGAIRAKTGDYIAVTQDGQPLLLGPTPAIHGPKDDPDWTFSASFVVKSDSKVRALLAGLPKGLVRWGYEATNSVSGNTKEAHGSVQGSGSAQILKDLIKGQLSASGDAAWKLNPNTCRFDPEALQVTVEASVEGRIPAEYVVIPSPWGDVAAMMAGGIINGAVRGSAKLDKENFPIPAGDVEAQAGGGLFAYFVFAWGLSQGDGKLQINVTGAPKKVATWPQDWDMRKLFVTADAELATGEMKYNFHKEYVLHDSEWYGNTPQAASRLLKGIGWSSSPASSVETTTLQIVPAIGSARVHGPNSLLGNVAGDLIEDGAPSLVSDQAGVAHAFWARHSEDVASSLGGWIMHAVFENGTWSVPERLTGTQSLVGQVVASRDPNGDLIVAWQRGDANGLNLNSDGQVVLARQRNAEIWQIRKSAGAWMAPTVVVSSANSKSRLALLSGGGNLWLSWIETGPAGGALMAARWNGTSWDAPATVATGLIGSAATYLSLNGTPTLAWTQNITNPSAFTSTVGGMLLASRWQGADWSAVFDLTPGDSAVMTLGPSPEAATAGGWEGLWLNKHLNLATTPPQSVCKKDKDDPKLDATKPPTGTANGGGQANMVNAHDPNDISGPAGVGDARWIARDGSYSYLIRFENDPVFATAAAQRVVITAPLDTNANEDSFRLSSFGFGDQVFNVPANRSFYNTRVGPYPIEVITGTTMMLMVDVLAGIDVVNHEAFWIFQTVDAATGGPPSDPLMGFLPPDYLDGNGQGFVNYSIRPKATLTTGALIAAQAFIIFDDIDILPTNVATNTIDADRPWSALASISASSTVTRLLQWTAGDEPVMALKSPESGAGSGLRDVSIYVSENGGAYGLWQTFGPATNNAIFTGTPGTTYQFYALASDNVGLVEAGKGAGAETSSYIPVIKRAMLPVVRR